MIKLKTHIRFTAEGRNFSRKHFRPVLNLGDGVLLSGNLISRDEVYLYNQEYDVDIDLFTVTEEIYSSTLSLLEKGKNIGIQEGSKKIVGMATVEEVIVA